MTLTAQLASIALAAALPAAALASSDEAWQEFRAEVETACSALAPHDGETVIEVNPFGSESYGAAMLITSMPDGSADRYVCIYDKQAKTAEITAPFPPPEPIAETVAEPDGALDTEIVPETGAELIGK